MRKPGYLALLGISIVVAAGSLGVTLTNYLGLIAYSPKGEARAAATAVGPDVPATPAEQWNNVFAPGDGMKMASRLPAVDAKTGSQGTRGHFILVGTIVSSTPSARRAVLWANGMKEPKAFREKEEVEPGAFLASVERDKVWIARGKEREKLEILPVGSRVRPTATGAPSVTPSVTPSVAAATSLPVSSPGTPSRPGTAASPRSSPDRTPAVAAPDASSGASDDEGPSRRERRRRTREYPR